MNQEEKTIYTTDDFEWLAKVIVRYALTDILNPVEFHREGNDGVPRMKIMFYKPNNNKINKKKSNEFFKEGYV